MTVQQLPGSSFTITSSNVLVNMNGNDSKVENQLNKFNNYNTIFDAILKVQSAAEFASFIKQKKRFRHKFPCIFITMKRLRAEYCSRAVFHPSSYNTSIFEIFGHVVNNLT